ncbi:Ribosomal protein L6 [Elusimicrobium minutum Pei191]|uniref:50S ribosomal protein L6 n=1 Tax=Elusimicrobium minutum (strain Pei191) TaxID=445932 RepID=B2KEK6_ELUMP|nr:50S ribosomal protein L6 [Elusimicrobium minutum]ACC98952.1 Ribosomal protein L6 [Elusimicrobium minutum Pei191]
MSRIGKKPIQIPGKVKVDIKGAELTATGPLGSLNYTLPSGLKAVIDNGILNISIEEKGKEKLLNAIHGTTRANVFNVIEGVDKGFSKVLEINGLGYKAIVAGTKLTIEVGLSHPVIFDIPKGLTAAYDGKTNTLEIKGSDKFLVGDFAAKIRRVRPPEPYKGSGIKYQGEHIARKAGKTAAGGK